MIFKNKQQVSRVVSCVHFSTAYEIDFIDFKWFLFNVAIEMYNNTARKNFKRFKITVSTQCEKSIWH